MMVLLRVVLVGVAHRVRVLRAYYRIRVRGLLPSCPLRRPLDVSLRAQALRLNVSVPIFVILTRHKISIRLL